MRDVGELGESTLKMWASQVGLVANKANQDKTGWDFFLESIRPHVPQLYTSIALDRDPYPLKCLVQVKSTDKQPGKWGVKLDNWERLVKARLPTFFLILEFDDQDTCQRAFLVYVGEDYIRRVLKRLREIDVSERSSLHNKTLQLTYNSEHVLSSLDGKGLEEAVRRHIGETAEQYAQKKIDLVNNVGYEDADGILKLVVSLPEDEDVDVNEYLVDFSLGLVPHLDVANGYFTDQRFGVLATTPSLMVEEGTIFEIERTPVTEATLLFYTSDYQRELRLTTDVYVPQGFSAEELNHQQYKIRLAAPFVDIVVWPYSDRQGKVSCTLPDPTEEHRLIDIQAVAELLLFFNDVSVTHDHVRFELKIGSSRPGSGYFNAISPLHEHIAQYVTAIDHARQIAKHFDVEQHVQLKPVELLPQQDQLRFMNLALNSRQNVAKISFHSREYVPGDDQDFCCPFIETVIVGQYRMLVAGAVLGSLNATHVTSTDGSEFEVSMTNIIIRRQHLYNREDVVPFTAKSLLDSVIENFKETHHILLVSDTGEVTL